MLIGYWYAASVAWQRHGVVMGGVHKINISGVTANIVCVMMDAFVPYMTKLAPMGAQVLPIIFAVAVMRFLAFGWFLQHVHRFDKHRTQYEKLVERTLNRGQLMGWGFGFLIATSCASASNHSPWIYLAFFLPMVCTTLLFWWVFRGGLLSQHAARLPSPFPRPDDR